MKTIILICGVATSGKDTLLNTLIARCEDHFGGDWRRFAFADKLKEECEDEVQEKFKVSVWDDNHKSKFRQLLTDHGQKRRAETDGNAYTDVLKEEVKQDGNIIVTDFRYINEYQDYGDDVRVIPVYLQRYIINGSYESGNKKHREFVLEPTLPAEVEAYHTIRQHPDTMLWRFQWLWDSCDLDDCMVYHGVYSTPFPEEL
jgi:hypothetical protein